MSFIFFNKKSLSPDIVHPADKQVACFRVSESNGNRHKGLNDYITLDKAEA